MQTKHPALALTAAIAFPSLSIAIEIPTMPGAGMLSPKARLGQQVFFDRTLSEPPGQSCSSCHDPRFAFTDPNKDSPTSDGASPALKGSRNTPTAAYTAFSPRFHFNRSESLFLGGQFVDGRSADLSDQAKKPFLNPIEMANPNAASVVEKVRNADYAAQFDQVYGPGALADDTIGYDRIADALAAFERSRVFSRFSSKYDFYLAGKAKLSAAEKRGRKVFEDEGKGNCAACHPSRPAADGTPALFTDFSYDNLGIPRNPANPVYSQPAEFNPAGFAFVDKGLGGVLGSAAENGKFKVPTLRNIAITGPYMHNGYFNDLEALVVFYNDRDVRPRCRDAFVAGSEAVAAGCWPAPEVSENVNRAELGNLGLTRREIRDLLAFLRTLTDGYEAPSKR